MKKIGAYTIIRTIRSQPRLIFLAKHPEYNQVQMTTASKITPIAFLQEAEHPVILPILDVIDVENKTYIVEPYLQGSTLEMRLEKSYFFPQKAAYILERLSSALDYALAHRVAYNHLHPRDILFDQSGEIFLPASECQQDPHQGYVQYRRIHIRTMGRLLFAMLTSYLPPDQEETYKQVPQLSNYRGDLSAGYQSIIDKCFNQNGTNRFESTRAVVRSLWHVVNEPNESTTAAWQPAIIIDESNLDAEVEPLTLSLAQRILIVVVLILFFIFILMVILFMFG